MELRNNLVVVDVETTGPDPFIHDLLAVALVPVLRPERAMVVYVRDDELSWTDFGRENFRKYEDDWNRLALAPIDAFGEIEQYFEHLLPDETATMVGHNVGFDLTFLRKLAFLSNRPTLPRISHRSIDTHSLLYLAALQHGWPTALSSDAAFELLNISPPDNQRHTALGDALATRLLFLRLLDILNPASRQSLRRSIR